MQHKFGTAQLHTGDGTEGGGRLGTTHASSLPLLNFPPCNDNDSFSVTISVTDRYLRQAPITFTNIAFNDGRFRSSTKILQLLKRVSNQNKRRVQVFRHPVSTAHSWIDNL